MKHVCKMVYKEALQINKGIVALFAVSKSANQPSTDLGKGNAAQHQWRWKAEGLCSNMRCFSRTRLQCRWLRACWGPPEQLLAVSVMFIVSTACGKTLHLR